MNWKRNHRYSNWGYAYANGFVVLAEGLDMFRLVTVATGGNIKPSDNLLRQELCLTGYFEGEPRLKGSAWPKAFESLGGIILAEGLA
jgi:hypothetical protein